MNCYFSSNSIFFFHSSSISSTYGAPLRTGELGGSTVGYPPSGIPNIGAEFGIRQSRAQIDELKKKLKMVITPVWMLQLKPLPLIKYESFKPLKKLKLHVAFLLFTSKGYVKFALQHRRYIYSKAFPNSFHVYV